jgi:tRNA(His) 5'-end guanylyltransferase
MIAGLSVDEKINLLFEECNIVFNNYPKVFRRGAALYKAPNIVNGIIKNKWIINEDLPIFNKNQSFISNILKNGLDIFTVL